MKKFLIGCGVLVVILIAIVIGAVVWVGGKFKGLGEQMQAAHQQLLATNQRFPFSQPADGLLGEERLAAWLKVAGAHAAQTEHLGNIDQKNMKPLEVARSAMTIPQQVIQDLIQQLGQANMSFDEYRWIAGQITGALNSGDARQDQAFAQLVKAVEPENGASHGNGFNPLHELSEPMTTAQIRHMLDLLKRHEAEFITASKALAPDTMAFTMTASQGRRQWRHNATNAATTTTATTATTGVTSATQPETSPAR